MKRIYKKYQSGKGFTLLEMLIVVAILVILMGITIVSLVSLRKNLRQKQLDYCAELVYMAAQNQLVELGINEDNYESIYGPGATAEDVQKMGYLPAGTETIRLDDGTTYPTNDTLYYVCSWANEGVGNTARTIVPSSKISAEIWSGDWVIEYAPDEAYVFAVYYSEASADGTSRVQDYGTDESSDFRTKLREKDNRLNDGAQVGYYGGDAAADFKYDTLNPSIVVYNEEELVAYISCVSPDKKPLTFNVTLTDSKGTKVEVSSTDAAATLVGQNRWVATVVLDSLDEGNRFNDKYPNLTPGSDLTLEVTVSSESSLVNGRTLTQPTLTSDSTTPINSLYDSVTTETGKVVANIRTARHLQNLDEAAYGTFESAITKAVQLNDISFLDDGIEATNDFQEEWYTIYSNREFDPITCDSLTSYAGNGNQIVGLQANDSTATSSGLFASTSSDMTIENLTLSGTTIAGKNAGALIGSISGGSISMKNLTITGATVSANRYAGALVGVVSGGNIIVDNCRVILEETDLEDAAGETWPAKTWISGSYVGGLIGGVLGTTTVTIDNSLAATVVGKTGAATGNATYAGGLIGYCSAKQLSIESSYASCYLAGNNTGALVGCARNNNITLSNCYAAGYQMATSTAAGLVNGPINSASNVYTATRYTAAEGNSSTVSVLSTATKADSLSNVFYLFAGTDTSPLDGSTKLSYEQLTGEAAVNDADNTILDLLGDKFSSTPADTKPYNLLNQGLSTYSYPSLTSLAHYGDWYAEFESGSLVYYEQYDEDTYGYYGANANTLKDQAVVGDGYGLIYEGTAPDGAVQITYPTGDKSTNTVTLDTDTYITLNDADDLVLLPLPDDLVNNSYAASDYWQKVTVVTSDSDQEEETKLNGEGKVYYINPHFALLVKGPYEQNAETPDLVLPDDVYIRSARQLYNLSLHYGSYENEDNHVYQFIQQVDIDYATYDWYTYTSYVSSSSEKITTQYAIGRSENSYVQFTDNYDGGCHLISNLSFASGNSAGLFADNAGCLQNIRLANEQSSNCVLTLNGQNLSGAVYAGVLAAQNSGYIDNCAVAGYNILVNASKNSSVYCGGLVGYNNRNSSISNCSAVCPVIQLTAQESEVRIGGFVGVNAGSVTGCYAINSLKQTENTNTKGDPVILAGFCAKNSLTISNSYTLSAFDVTGAAEKYSFSPAPSSGATLKNCYYLSGGIFRFAGSTYSYNNYAGGGTPKAYSELQALTLSGFGTAKQDNSYFHASTTKLDSDATAYPFLTSLKDDSGEAAHYGDWVASATSETAGIFYWEYEEGGDDEGYHISLVDDDSNLCDNHDDGGEIIAFGYGYFTKGDTNATLTMDSNFATGATECTLEIVDTNGKTTTLNVSTELAKLMPGYTFHAYRSLSSTDTTDKAKAGKLYLITAERNGVWTLKYDTTTVSYYVCPFFANALSLSTAKAVPGSADKPYQIRSVTQLQFINWNYSSKSCETDVTSSNYTNYPYLQYATVTKQGTQKQADVEDKRPVQYWTQTHDVGSDEADTSFWPIAGTSTGSTDVYYSIFGYYQGNPNAVLYTWFGGSYDGGSYKITNLNISSTLNNIGVFGYTCGAEMKNIILYSNRNSKIERVMSTKTVTITYGLFGYKSMKIPDNSNDAYAIGSLVGIAYDYEDDTTGTISNCAVAGYKIIDNSRNTRISYGDVNIGGLFGIANTNIVNCSSVVDIVVDTTFQYFACLGNTVRAGGIAGCCNYQLINCYSGGSITLGENAKAGIEGTNLNYRARQLDGFNVLGFSFASALKNINGDFYFTYYNFAGICAGNFGGNFMNFTGRGDFGSEKLKLTALKFVDFYDTNITQTFKNCYTYMEIDAVEGDRYDYDYHTGNNAERQTYNWGFVTYEYNSGIANIGVKSVMAIGGVPETLNDNSAWALAIYTDTDGGTTIDNCWYLESCITKPNYSDFKDSDGHDLTWEDYVLGRRSTEDHVNESDIVSSGSMTLEAMYNGELQSKLSATGTTVTINGTSYSGYQSVTTYENPVDKEEYGQYVGGKYSFPGDNAALNGTVFPYPSIITQTNSYGETVHVHYGEWQTGLLFFEEYYVNSDILRDGETITLKLTAQGDVSTDAAPALSFKDEDGYTSDLIAETYTCTSTSANDKTTWTYVLTAKGTGTVYITAETTTASGTAVSAGCQVNLTADITLTAQAISADGSETGFGGYIGDSIAVAFDAKYTDNDKKEIDLLKNYSDKLHWTVDLTDTNGCLIFTNDGTEYDANTAARAMKIGNNSFWGTQLDLEAEGDVSVTVTLKYAVDGWNGDGTTSDGLILTQECTFAVSVWSPTVFGIANTSGETPVYTQIKHEVPSDSMSAASADSGPELSSSTLYFYCTGTEANLADFLNGEFTVKVKDTSTGNMVETDNYYIEIGQVVSSGDYQVAPIVFNSLAGTYELTYTASKTASYLENGVATEKENVTYTFSSVPVSLEKDSELTITFEALLPDGTVGASTKTPITFNTSVTAPALTLPDYYHYADAWKATDGTALGAALKKNTTYQCELAGDEFTFNFTYGETTEKRTYTYSSDAALTSFEELFPNATDPVFDWTSTGSETIVIRDGETLSITLDALKDVGIDITTPIALVANLETVTTAEEESGNQGSDSGASEEVLTTGEPSEEAAEDSTEEATEEPVPEQETPVSEETTEFSETTEPAPESETPAPSTEESEETDPSDSPAENEIEEN